MLQLCTLLLLLLLQRPRLARTCLQTWLL